MPTEIQNHHDAAEAPSIRTELQVSGMTCQNCARHVREALENVPGVSSATVSLTDERASVQWRPETAVDENLLVESLDKAGYSGRLFYSPPAHSAHEGQCARAPWRFELWTGVAGMLLLMLGEWVFRLEKETWFRWFSFLIATAVQIFAGTQFYKGAWRQLRAGSSNMDTLVALGSTTAYLYSAFILFSGRGGHLYFMEAAAIISLISVGHWLEARVSAMASSSLSALFRIRPKTAHRLDNGRETEVPVEMLKVREHVLLRAGDQVPTDGIIIEGESAIDESMLTGESIPAEKSPGDEVYAGTINLTGRVIVRVTATGEQTALARIIQAVERSQNSRANIQRLGDRVSSVFVPIVVVVALATGILWAAAPATATAIHESLSRFLWHATLPEGRWAAAFIIPAAVLIVACPCAMGLATPTAIMAASNAASRNGILIRDGVALEKAGSVSAVIFDKTGTLTMGEPRIAASHVLSAPPNRQLDPIALAASLAQGSKHPVSRAIAAASKRGAGTGGLGNENAQFHLTDIAEVRGSGLQAQVAIAARTHIVRLGSLRWMEENSDRSENHPFVRKWTDEGATVIALALDGELLCFFAVKDIIKPDVTSVVRELSRSNLKVYLVTGDNLRTARSIARQADISAENVMAEVRPEAKAEVVKTLQQKGEHVAFVGDGINDAPALEQADLGIAVAKASDVAHEAADIILLNSEISAVPLSLNLARATLRTIRQNLFWAFFYNAAAIPLAAFGFMSPILCAAAMGLSDILIIGNALRLLRRSPQP